jgi:uncharacterized membrane protein
MPIGRFMGYLHPALVQFPIVLLLAAVALEGVGFARRDARFDWAGKLLLCGIALLIFSDRDAWPLYDR